MAITSFTIDGTEVRPVVSSFDVRETVGGTSTLSCDLVSSGLPVERYAVFSEVAIVEDGVTIFAGVITQARERGLGGQPIVDAAGTPTIVTTITAEDHNRIAERITGTFDVPDGMTLKALLTAIVANYLTGFGVTLDAAQVTGPALPAMSFTITRMNEILQAVADATGYLWRIGYDKALRMWAEGDLVAPFNLDQADVPPKWGGDVEVETILGDSYANRVKVLSDAMEEERHVETFVGDGVTSTFALNWTLIKAYGIIHRYLSDGVTPNGGETFGIPPDAPIQWSYDRATNSITRDIGPPDSGDVYKLTFHGTFQASATAEDAAEIAAHGVYEHIERRSDITTAEAAQDIADALLAQLLTSGDQTLTYTTRYPASTLRAGQRQTIVCPARNINGTFIIRDLQIRTEVPPMTAGSWLTRSVTAKATDPLQGKWQHTYRDWLKFGGGGNVTVTGTGGVASTGPAPPVTSVQFNRDGSFGGDERFTYNEAASTPMVGTGHTPAGQDNLLVGEGHTVT